MKTNAERLAEMAADPGDRRHGTATGYDYGCRCDACRSAAHERHMRRYEGRRKANAEKRAEREAEKARRAAVKPAGGRRAPKPHPKDVCTVPAYLRPLMGRPSIDNVEGRCVWCGAPATDRHHIVKRSQGRWVRDGVEVRKPTVRLCGSGNACGCHGKAHAGMLHFRWVQHQPDSRRPLAEAGPGLPGHWEALETSEPCRTLEAWRIEEGWRRLR